MTFQNFPPSLLTLSPRLTRTGDPGASIAGINTTIVADGAWCYCVENKHEYQLDRADDTTPPDGNTVIAPLSGPGRWFRRDFGGGADDHTVLVSGADTTPGFLGQKIPTTTDVQATIGNPGANETVLLKVVGLTESSGPTDLPIGDIGPDQYLRRVGGSIIGVGGGGSAQATQDVGNTFALNGVNQQWIQATGAAFAYEGTTDFTLTAASCVLTYNGPNGRRFLLLYTCSAEAQGGTDNGTSGIAVAHNNDLTGGAMFSNAATLAGATYVDLIAGGALTATCQRSVVLNTGDTLRPLASKFIAAADWDVHSLSLSVVPQ